MANHTHDVRYDLVQGQLDAASALGGYDIPTAMTWPLAQLKRSLRHLAETVEDAGQTLQDTHTVGERVSGKFVPAVVYATNPDGSPRFKLDDTGKPTAEREVAHGKIQMRNLVAYQRAQREQARMKATVSVPHLSWPQLEGKVAKMQGNIVEALMDYFDDLPAAGATENPEPAVPAPARARKAGAR